MDHGVCCLYRTKNIGTMKFFQLFKVLPVVVTLFISCLLMGNDAFIPSHTSIPQRGDGMVVVGRLFSEPTTPHHLTGRSGMNKRINDLLLCTTAAIVLTFSPVQQVSALSFNQFDQLPTIQIADNVKELDFSLPSYEDIKSPKASTENSQSLTIQTKPFDPTTISLRTSSSAVRTATDEEGATSTTATPRSDNSVSNPLSSILPSMNKKGPKQKTSYDGYTF